jgi:CheY-like chemotaxis protein
LQPRDRCGAEAAIFGSTSTYVRAAETVAYRRGRLAGRNHASLGAYNPPRSSSSQNSTSRGAFAKHGDFDEAVCVLLDINLGDGSGIELRHSLKRAGNNVPAIFMTGNEDPVVRMIALQSGCLAYLTKPFSAMSLIEPLERASAGLA